MFADSFRDRIKYEEEYRLRPFIGDLECAESYSRRVLVNMLEQDELVDYTLSLCRVGELKKVRVPTRYDLLEADELHSKIAQLFRLTRDRKQDHDWAIKCDDR